jgi:hypothetical protein
MHRDSSKMSTASALNLTVRPEDIGKDAIDLPGELSGQRPYRVILHGLEFFCKRLPAAFETEGWEIQYPGIHGLPALWSLMRDLRRADLLFIWGARVSFGKFLSAARLCRKDNIVLFWSGSDVLGAQMQFSEGIMEPWIANKIHWAGAPWLAEEIRAIGLKCEYVPITWVPSIENPEPLPDKFSVLVYLPSIHHSKLYGLDRILQVARSLAHISFELVGLNDGEIKEAPPNLRMLGQVQEMSVVYRRASVYWRPVSHDGLSFMALEALSYGRHVLWSYPFPYCYKSSSAESDRAEIERLHALHGRNELSLNEAGIALVSEKFGVETIKRDFLRRWQEIIVTSTQSKGKLVNGYKTPALPRIS